MFTPLNSIKRSSRNSGSNFPYKEILDSLQPGSWNTLLWRTMCPTHMPKMVVEDTANGVLLRVVVKPKSKARSFIQEIGMEAVKLNLRAPAREGKANIELLKRVAKLLKLSTADIILVSGSKSRDKTLLIRGVMADRVLSVLQAVKNNK